MNNRIALVLKAKNISPSVLADDLGVQRSGISHILNGRNKPSLEFIQKLIKLYPDISIQWILFGDGPMMNPYPLPDSDVPKSVQSSTSTIEKPKTLRMELFDSEDDIVNDELTPERDMDIQNVGESFNNQPDTRFVKETDLLPGKIEVNEIVEKPQIAPAVKENHQRRSEVSGPEAIPSTDKNKKPDKHFTPDRKISKIVVFYSDRTFVEYSPGEEQD
jgi:transcriptional regulator with XRE-family HTH domain